MKLFDFGDLKLSIGKLRRIDWRHYVCSGITVLFLLLAVFRFEYAYLRIGEAMLDVYNSVRYCISGLFGLKLKTEITVLKFSSQPFKMPFNLPNTWEEFKILWGVYWEKFFSLKSVGIYFEGIGNFLFNSIKVFTLIVPLSILFFVVLKREPKHNNNYNVDSKPLKIFKKAERRLIVPIWRGLKGFVGFLKEMPIYLNIWTVIWAYSFNLVAIVIEVFAYYFYFVASFDIASIYTQVLKLLIDLSVALDFIPGYIWFIIVLYAFNVMRRDIGFSKLEHMELKNRGFINERPIVIMVCGTMGKKKTTVITDIALSQEIMFRQKALEKIIECDVKFPFFPWINFENALKRAMENHSVYNLATARRFVQSKKMKFLKHPKRRYIFMYDFEKYEMNFNDNLRVINIWETIEIYAQLYFVYVIQSSLLISNYSIRTDNRFKDLGNFPFWSFDLFHKDSGALDECSRHSHILDFDALRLGKKLLDENKYSDSFEFGVINITEIGKERGNNLELQQVKKTDDSTNQKNDLFNSWLKMVRHSATIDNFPFVKVICDEQRPESWGADARDLCEIVHIDDCSELKLSMPFFALEELACGLITCWCSNKFWRHRYFRGDNTLLMYLMHALYATLYRYKLRTYNQFGYYKLNLDVEQGTQDGELKDANYYLMCKKIYSKRFSTDCFSDFFNEKALRSSVGLDDLPEFKTEKASFDELASENSYFFNDLTKLR